MIDLFQTLPAARSVALCAELSGRLVLVGGELAPSGRGHAGAGNFSDQATVLDPGAGAGVRLVGESQGPRARGWSAGGVWRGQAGERMVVVAGLTGDDNNPVRLMDVWMGEM